jgi:hypothetical protein
MKQPKSLIEYQRQLRMGIKTEAEHHLGSRMASKIARDHLREDKNYYTKLRRARL